MIRSHVLSALAATGLLLGTGVLTVNAADYDGSYQGSYSGHSRYSQDFADDPADTARPSRHHDYENDRPDVRPAPRWRHGGRFTERIEARSSYASDYGPRDAREARARRSAIEAWKNKVENIYGRRFANWRFATGKQVSCDTYRGNLSCIASARPVPGSSRWSWYRQ